MTIETLTSFFMWSTLLSWGMQIFAFVMILAVRDWAYRVHSKMFPVTKDQFNLVIYSTLIAMKTLTILLFFIPWMALLIVK